MHHAPYLFKLSCAINLSRPWTCQVWKPVSMWLKVGYPLLKPPTLTMTTTPPAARDLPPGLTPTGFPAQPQAYVCRIGGGWSRTASSLHSAPPGGEPVLAWKLNSCVIRPVKPCALLQCKDVIGAASLTVRVYRGTAQNDAVVKERGLPQVYPNFPQPICRHKVPRREFSDGRSHGVRKQPKTLPSTTETHC